MAVSRLPSKNLPPSLSNPLIGAKVRKVFLRGLPITADLTLVQSLIHGGAIDTYALGGNGTAAVTFTAADACDAYYAKYPNGLKFKYNGKDYVAYVDKSTDVNVISGMLQGQLACGASRCVRAVGADHDWGMRALIKLAEGKTRKGKVENIVDAWRNEVSWTVKMRDDLLNLTRSAQSFSASLQSVMPSLSRQCSFAMMTGRPATSNSWMIHARKRTVFISSKLVGEDTERRLNGVAEQELDFTTKL